MKNTVRKRDIAFSGSVNPMLQDFGESSEVYQYSGRKYDDSWQCPLKITHAETKHNPSA
jgi:FPC/CPF motif-containing protein YcgG